jgi:hypothetical protein
VQTALLGKPEEKSAFSSFMNELQSRLRSSGKPNKQVWPTMPIEIQADSLVLGPTILKKPSIKVRVVTGSDLNIESWSTGILGGTASGTGTYSWSNDRPNYQFEGNFTGLDPVLVGTLVGSRFTGSTTRDSRKSRSTIAGSGKIALSGLDSKQISLSASGEVQFDWNGGTIETADPKPIHFTRWSGTLDIQNGKAQLAKNILISPNRPKALAQTLEGSISFTDGTVPGAAKFSLIASDPPKPSHLTPQGHPRNERH